MAFAPNNNRADETSTLLDSSVRKPNGWKRGAGAVGAAVVVAGIIGAAAYYGPRLLEPTNLATAVTRDNLVKHLEAFSAVAASQDGFGNSRSILNGYNASVEYVVNQLKTRTDYIVTVQPFDFPFFENVQAPKLTYSAASVDLVAGRDFDTLTNSGSGSVKDAKIQVILNGCLPEDFKTFKKGAVVLLAREVPTSAPGATGCTYRTKITNAINAGASAALLYTTLPMGGPVLGRAGPDAVNFPVLGLVHPVALDLLQKAAAASSSGEDLKVSLTTSVQYRTITTLNVIADTPAGNKSTTIVAGSHLDSVPAGPGINDDGSGSAATLEVALSLYRTGLSKRV
ncbi:hypothetical protein HDU76_005876, partial [Blyttiomyces sp. JEL0837]